MTKPRRGKWKKGQIFWNLRTWAWTFCQTLTLLQLVGILSLIWGAGGSGLVCVCNPCRAASLGLRTDLVSLQTTRVSPPLSAGQPGIMSRCQEHGDRHATTIYTQVTRLQPDSIDVPSIRGPENQQPELANNEKNKNKTHTYQIIIVTTGYLPKILVHGFKEEFVAIDGSVVEDIFKIR